LCQSPSRFGIVFYNKVLLESQAAEIARQYINKRKLTPDVVDGFLLGYSPDKWEVLLEFLKKKGYKEEEINQAGLAVRKERGTGYYDRFRNRVMFPIQNIHGKVVGFTARLLDSEAKEAKYINTPQTSIYSKSEVLYGLDKAKRVIQENDLAVIVEGNMDVITSHKVGVQNVIASSGTAMTEGQVNLIKRFSNNIAFCFDSDSAGRVAMKRGIDMALSNDMKVSVILFKDKEIKDPDEIINSENGKALWEEAIKSRLGVMEYYFKYSRDNFDLSSADGKKNASRFLLLEISRLPDKVEQTHWLQELAKMIDVREEVLRESLPQKDNEMKSSELKPVVEGQASGDPKEIQAWSKLISILINRPELIESVKQSFHPEYIVDESYQQLYKNLILFYNEPRQSESFDEAQTAEIYAELVKFLEEQGVDEKGVELFHVLALAGERDWRDMETESLKQELLKISEFTESIFKQTQKEKLTKEMREAEAKGDKEKVEEIMKLFQQFE
jgi:DNA primase